MDFQNILFVRKDGVVTVTINRPERVNALSIATMRELRAALRVVREDSEARALVLTGAGKYFCAGGDVSEMQPHEPREWSEIVREYLDYVADLYRLDIPTIAKINGDAVGGGCCTAMACDLRFAATTARLGAPFVRIGLAGADMGATYFLPRLVGPTRAAELLLTGRLIEAAEAERIGLITRAVAPEQLDAVTAEYAEAFRVGPSLALRMTKRALARSLDRDFEAQADFETFAQSICLTTEDHREGAQAFREKRRPMFGGQVKEGGCDGQDSWT